MNLKDKIIIYLYRKTNDIEQDKEQLQLQRRYQPMDDLDTYENLRSQIRAECWQEFVDELLKIVIYNYPQNKSNYTK